MSSMLDHEALVSTTRVDSDAVILEFVHQLRSEGASESHISQHPGPVRHFLTWLELHGIAVEAINGAVIEQFLRARLRLLCPRAATSPVSSLA